MTPASAPCPLPDTPAMPTISPACTVSEAAASPARPCGSVTVTRSSTSSARARRARRAAALRHLAPDHQLGERRAVGARGRAVRDLAAGAQHRDAVGDRQHLVQLVRDEDDREPVRHQAPQHDEQAFDLLRGEHRGRLVEHEDARAAIEHLQDFEPLLLADAQARHAPVGRHVEAAVGHQREQLLARARQGRAAASRAAACRARRSPARSGFRRARSADAPCRRRHRARPAASRARAGPSAPSVPATLIDPSSAT